MRKTTVISLALLSILAIGAGCINTSITSNETPSPALPATNTPSASSAASNTSGTVTADSVISAKLTAAGLTVTTKDKSASIAKMEMASAITKATELNISTDGDKVAISVLELNDATKTDAVKKQVEDQWALAKAYDAKISGEFVDIGSNTTIVSIISKAGQAATVQKIKYALRQDR